MAITAEKLRVIVEADTDDAVKGLQGVEREGSKIPSWAGIATKAIAGFGAAAATYFGAKAVLQGGLSRLMNIEDAQAALKGIGHTQESISNIMDSALSSVRGTAFGLGDAAKIAATAVAAGIKPGEDLTRTLRLTANTAALAQTGLGEMGSILNKVWTSGRVGTEELNQLADRGIPIWTKLAESYGVSADELRKMVSSGKVDAASFASVLESTVGNAAISMGDTTRGAFANMQASVARVGANFLQGVFPMFKSALQGITDALGPVEERAKVWGAALGEAATWVVDRFSGMATQVGAQVSAVVGILRTGDFTSAFREAFNVEEDAPVVGVLLRVRDAVLSTVAEVQGGLTAMRAAFAEGGTDVTSSGIAGALEAIGLAARNYLTPVIAAFQSLAPTLAPVIPQVLAAVSAFNPLGLVLKALVPVLPQIGALVGQLAATFVGALAPVLATLVPLLANVAGILVGALTQAFVGLLPVLTGLLPVVTQVVQIVGQVLASALTAVAPLLTMLASLIASLVPVVASLIPPVLSVVQALLPIVQVVGDLIGALLPPLVSLFMAVLPPIAELVGVLVGALAPILTTVAQIISAVLVPIIRTLAEWFGKIVAAVAPVVSAILSGLISALTSLVSGITRVVSAVAGFVRDAIAGIGAFVNVVSSGFNTVNGWFGGLKDSILGAIGNAGKWLYDSGKAILDGLVDGIKSAAKKVTDAVGNVLKSARDLLPFSPAKKGPFSGKGWTLYSGRSISSALAQGIEDQTRDVRRAALGMVEAAQVPLPGMSLPGLGVGATQNGRPAAGVGNGGTSPADALGVGSGSTAPSTLVLVDQDGALIGRMRVEAGRVATGDVTPLDEGRTTW